MVLFPSNTGSVNTSGYFLGIPLQTETETGITYSSVSQRVVRVPLVVREGLPGGARVTSIFSQKPGFTAF